MRALLSRPVLLDDLGIDARGRGSREATFVEEAFVLVRRHAGYLGDWFARHTGWTLIVRSDSARLVKRPVETGDATRMAISPGSSRKPLTRDRYVMWCLLLTVLHEEGRQSTLRHLAEKTVSLAATMPEIRDQGIEYDLKTAVTRRALVCVIRMAITYGVLYRVGGHEDRFAQNASVDCLYNINPALLTDLLMLPTVKHSSKQTNDGLKRPPEIALPTSSARPSQKEGEADIQTVFDEESLERFLDPLEDEIRPRQLEQRLIRRMLDDPVMYFEDLTEQEYQYFQAQRSRLFEVIETATGLIAELRAEGVAMLDPIGDLTDVQMPDSGTVGHATLLIAEYLSSAMNTDDVVDEASSQNVSDSSPRQRPNKTVSVETLLCHLSELAAEHQSHWRKGITELSQVQSLLDECLSRLEMLRMICRTRDGGIIARPAIARFVADEPVLVRTEKPR